MNFYALFNEHSWCSSSMYVKCWRCFSSGGYRCLVPTSVYMFLFFLQILMNNSNHSNQYTCIGLRIKPISKRMSLMSKLQCISIATCTYKSMYVVVIMNESRYIVIFQYCWLCTYIQYFMSTYEIVKKWLIHCWSL